jgi:orotate phosphoribosyltransferase
LQEERIVGSHVLGDEAAAHRTLAKQHLIPHAAAEVFTRAAGVVIALDRMERGTGAVSAVEEVRDQMGLPVVSIANLDDIVDYLSNDPGMAASLAAVEKYRALYGSR